VLFVRRLLSSNFSLEVIVPSFIQFLEVNAGPAHEEYIYRVFSVQADWTLTHPSHKDTEQSTIEASMFITLDGITLID
jgi:hypothetical protein